jgi:hypothetical protein
VNEKEFNPSPAIMQVGFIRDSMKKCYANPWIIRQLGQFLRRSAAFFFLFFFTSKMKSTEKLRNPLQESVNRQPDLRFDPYA